MFRSITVLGVTLGLFVITTGAAVSAKPKKPSQPVSYTCEITGKPRWQCCGSKAVPSPPCCQKRCATAGKIVRP
jgi:hypothetical protein